MKACIIAMEACIKATEACLGKTEARNDTGHQPREAEIKPGLEGMNATESEAMEGRQEVPNEEAAMETIGILEDRPGYQQQAVEYQNPLKRRTQDNDV
jgi:hypothetical protein